MNDIKKIFNYFLIGVFAFIPIAVILEIVLFGKTLIAATLQLIYSFSESYTYTATLVLLSFAFFVYLGYRVSVGRSLVIRAIDTVIERIPLLNTVYRVTKKIVNLVTGHDKREAREVVYVEYPKEGLWVPAYVTNKKDDMYVLFIPTSPNPTSGFTVIVHKSKTIKSTMNIEQATSYIVSVGVDFDRMDETARLH
ncbi:MAG: DUF502 domain-containing protein [Gammaproteobacteria bacterium]